MSQFNRICVFCGSSPGLRAEYVDAAQELARSLVSAGIELVYGGAEVGVMGVVANTALEAGGSVTGVIPRNLVDREIAHRGLTRLHVVETMHERKALMAELSDGFIALPGGLGTLEELFEALTWSQLGIHVKPCGFLNTCGYYDELLRFLDHAVSEQFIKPNHRAMIMAAVKPWELLQQFADYAAPQGGKWVTPTTEG